jgi:hypothetical protein
MKKFYNVGIANQVGPESCACIGNGMGEALTGGSVGWVLSFEIPWKSGVDPLGLWGRQYGPDRIRKDRKDLAESKTPCMCWNLTRGNREILQTVRGDYRTSLENSKEVQPWRT